MDKHPTKGMRFRQQGRIRLRSLIAGGYLLAVVLSTLSWTTAFASPRQEEAPKIEVRLQQPNIYLGDKVDYEVKVLNLDTPPEPVLPPVEGVSVEYLGDQGFNQRFTQIIEGRYQTVRSFGRSFHYRFTAARGGDIVIPAPRVTVDGEVIEGKPVTLHVVEPKAQELVILHGRVERNGRLPLQPFRVVLQVFVKNLPPPHARRSPTSVLGAPALNVPWAEAPDGLLATQSFSDWLTPLIARTKQEPDGFTINDTKKQRRGLFIGFDEPETFEFDLNGRPATNGDVADIERLAGKAHQYHVYELAREFQPRRSGRFTIPATSIKGDFVAGLRSGRALPETVFDLGGEVEVVVDDPPNQGRPESWQGTVGKDLRLIADLRPTRARVGDPMTLTVSVTGMGNLDQLPPLDFGSRPPVSESFRVQDPTVEVEDGLPVFTYSVRATHGDVSELPPIELSWFDLSDESYHSTSSASIPVTIEAIETLGGTDIVSGGAPARQDLARQDGLFGNVTDPNRVRDERVDLAFLGMSWGLAAGLFVLLSLIISRTQRLREDPARVRRRKAGARAKERMTAAATALSGDAATAAPELHGVFAGLIADVADVPEASVTPRDATRHLEELGVDSVLTQRVRTLLDQCDGLRFGGSGSSLGGEAESLLGELIDAFSQLGRLR